MEKTMDKLRGFDPLRLVMLAKPGRVQAVGICALLCAGFFGASLLLMSAAEGAATIAIVGTVCVGMLLLGAYRALSESESPVLVWLCVGALCMLAVGAHLAMLDIKPGRYTKVLAPLLENQWNYEMITAMAWDEQGWSGGYLLICALISRLENFNALYAFKLVDMVFQCAAACAVAKMARLRGAKMTGIVAGMLACVLAPTMLMNAGCWAQCDAMFAALTLWGLYLALDRHPLAGCILLGAALATKLQSAFVFPLLIVLFMNRKISLRHLAALCAAFVLVQLPILLDGYGFENLLSRYAIQLEIARDSYGLTDNAPGVFGMMKTASVREFSGMGLYLGISSALLVVLALLRAKKPLSHETLLLGALLLAAGLPLVLPQMNARCLYLGTMLAFALASNAKRTVAALLLEFVSLCSYMKSIFSFEILNLQVLSLIAFGAAIVILLELLAAIKEDQSAAEGEKA